MSGNEHRHWGKLCVSLDASSRLPRLRLVRFEDCCCRVPLFCCASFFASCVTKSRALSWLAHPTSDGFTILTSADLVLWCPATSWCAPSFAPSSCLALCRVQSCLVRTSACDLLRSPCESSFPRRSLQCWTRQHSGCVTTGSGAVSRRPSCSPISRYRLGPRAFLTDILECAHVSLRKVCL